MAGVLAGNEFQRVCYVVLLGASGAPIVNEIV